MLASIKAWLLGFQVVDAVVGRLYLIWSDLRREAREEADREALKQRDDKHEEIRANASAHAVKRGWLRDTESLTPRSARRSDGAFKDYDVSGKGGQLDRE